MSCFDSIDPCELAALGSAIAIGLSENMNADELNVVGNLVVEIGSIMLTIAAQKQNLEAIQNKQNEINNAKK